MPFCHLVTSKRSSALFISGRTCPQGKCSGQCPLDISVSRATGSHVQNRVTKTKFKDQISDGISLKWKFDEVILSKKITKYLNAWFATGVSCWVNEMQTFFLKRIYHLIWFISVSNLSSDETSIYRTWSYLFLQEKWRHFFNWTTAKISQTWIINI